MENKSDCPHRYTFTKDDLFRANPIFSRKTCELCGATITLDRKYKLYIFLFVTAIVLVFLGVPYTLRDILPGISYFAKGLIVVLIFVSVYAAGIYLIMKRATYHIYAPVQHVDNIGAGAYIRAKERAAARTTKFLKREK